MKYNAQKKQTQIRVSIALIALIITIATCLYITNTHNITKQTLFHERNKTIQQQSKLQRLLQEKKEFSESIKLWRQLQGESRSFDGLKIDDSKAILKNLEDTYKLTNTSITITPPIEIRDLHKNKTTLVISSEVTLSFETITDEIAFNFISELPKALPGYIKITSLKMERHNNLTDNTIKKLYNGTPVGLVKTNISFNWRDIKNIVPTDEIKTNNNTKL